MKKKSYILNQLERSRWWLAQFHWSFPIELGYMNIIPYRRIISKGPTENKQRITKLIDELKSDDRTLMSDEAKAMSVFLSETRCDAKSFCYKNFDEYMNDYLGTLDMIKKMPRSNFLNKSYDSVDTYGLGLSLMSVLNRTSNFIDKELAKDFSELFYKMYHPNLELRFTVDDSIVMYEKIVGNHILKKQKKQFRDHKIVQETETKKNLDKQLKNTHYNDVTISEKKLEKLTVDAIKGCPDGKEFNPLTKRCNKKCKTGFERDISFKCKKTARVRCPRGKERNPLTKRCVFKCKPGYKRDKQFKCKSKKTRKKMPSMISLNL